MQQDEICKGRTLHRQELRRGRGEKRQWNNAEPLFRRGEDAAPHWWVPTAPRGARAQSRGVKHHPQQKAVI